MIVEVNEDVFIDENGNAVDEDIVEKVKEYAERYWIDLKKKVKFYVNEDRRVVFAKMHDVEVATGVDLVLLVEVSYGMKFIQVWRLTFGGKVLSWIIALKDTERLHWVTVSERLEVAIGDLLYYLVMKYRGRGEEIGSVFRELFWEISKVMEGDKEWEV